MRRMRFLAVLLTLSLFTAACTSAEAPTEPSPSNPAEVQAAYAELNAAFAAGDIAGLMALYTDDAIRYSADQSVIEGREALRDDFETFYGENDYELFDEPSPPEILVDGALAVTISTYDEQYTPKAGGDTTAEAGQWIIVWQRQGGDWKVSREMWTSNRLLEIAP
jgi:ketosteroid isomerase-like protein